MDEYTSKRASGGIGFSKNGSSLAFRDPNHEERSSQYCSRLGCVTKLRSMKGTQVGHAEKFKYPKVSFRSTCIKAISGSSPRSLSSSSDFNRSHPEQHNQTSLEETDIAESSSRQVMIKDSRRYDRQHSKIDSESSSRQEVEDSHFFPITTGIQTVTSDSEDIESVLLQGFRTNTTKELGNDTSASRPRKQINRRIASGKQDASGLSVRRSFASRSTSEAAKPVSQGMTAGAQMYGLRNLGCTSIVDVLPSGCSPFKFIYNRKVNSLRSKPSDRESSLTATKVMSRSSSGGYSTAGCSSLFGLLPEHSSPQQSLRRDRNQTTKGDGAVSVRTRRVPSGETRMRLPEEEDNNSVSTSETLVISQLSHIQLSIPEVVPESSSRSSPVELPPMFCNSSRSGASSRTSLSRSSSRVEGNSTQSFHRHRGYRNSYRHVNLEGIAEVLLALERIEQQDLTYEQLLVLEANIYLGGISFHDQHRDMRMDIDSMSYEELLALEDKIGTVSTALSEEAIWKCLKRSLFIPDSACTGISCRGDEDIKCSICQEEYAVGEELGKLACEHRYHAGCIHQWLRQKNWCPICKVSGEKKQ